MKTALKAIAAQHGLTVHAKVPKSIEIDGPGKPSKPGKPKEDPKLKALLALDPQILLMKVLAKNKMNVTETTLERLFQANNVSTIGTGLQHVKASEVRNAFKNVLDATIDNWETKGFIVFQDTGVFFIEGDVKMMHLNIAQMALMIENRKHEGAEEELD